MIDKTIYHHHVSRKLSKGGTGWPTNSTTASHERHPLCALVSQLARGLFRTAASRSMLEELS